MEHPEAVSRLLIPSSTITLEIPLAILRHENLALLAVSPWGAQSAATLRRRDNHDAERRSILT